MKRDRINIGDIVSVHCNNGQTTISHRAEVLYSPRATGDSWIFKDIDQLSIIYVSEGCTIIKKYKELAE